MWLSYVILAVIAVAFIAVIVRGIYNKKTGKSSCSCGGNCGACGLCHTEGNDSDNKE